jgi:hypothetical protein
MCRGEARQVRVEHLRVGGCIQGFGVKLVQRRLVPGVWGRGVPVPEVEIQRYESSLYDPLAALTWTTPDMPMPPEPPWITQ